MRLAGYQSLTLIDYPDHLAAIVFTQGCPFRCVYCHNPELIPTQAETGMTEDQILERLLEDASMLDGVVVTGGEPTTHPDLPHFLKRIKALGLKVKLDTNGVNPRLIETCLQDNAVDFLAMDIKHRWEKYTDVIGPVPAIAIDNCQKTMSIIQASGLPYEFRTTLYSALHTEDDILEIAGYLKNCGTYTLQQVRYDTTFLDNLERSPPYDLRHIKSLIHTRFPGLSVEIKAES